jgi:hypothetical protein
MASQPSFSHADALPTAAPLAPAPSRPLAPWAKEARSYGYAPDHDHGLYAIGEVYERMDAGALERTLFVSSLKGEGVTLLTLGRWAEGFLDTVQVFWSKGHEGALPSEAAAILEGAECLFGVTSEDHGALAAWLRALGEPGRVEPLSGRALLPTSKTRGEFLAKERTLGIAREDLESDEAVRATFDELDREGCKAALWRILEAGRADLLTGCVLLARRAA